MESITLSQERIDKFRQWLKNAIPYTYEEIVNIPFDSTDYDMDRCRAYMAQKALREAGLLDEE